MIEVNKIYNESCLDTMARMPDGFVDLTFTSPPYNMRTRISKGKYTKREKSAHFSKKYTHFGDDLPIFDFYIFHSSVIRELLRVSKIVCYNFQIVTGSKEAFFKIVGDFNHFIKDMIIWDKGHGQPAMHSNVLNSCYEIILVLEGDGSLGRVIKNSKFERGKMDNILRVGRGKKIHGSHGAVFPEELASTIITSFSSVGDIIYDSFGGTGTTPKMALVNNRQWVVSEISTDYCEIMENRLNEIVLDLL